MLSLKSAITGQMAPGKTGLLDLPPELLSWIFDHVFSRDDLLRASVVSKRLRELALPIIYASLDLTFTTKVQAWGGTILDFLLGNSHLQKHVRRITIQPSFPKLDREWLEFEKFERLSPCLTNLRFLRICIGGELLIRLLMLPIAQEERVRISISISPCNFDSGVRYQSDLHLLSGRPVLALAVQLSYSSCVLEAEGRGASCVLQLAEVKYAIGRFTALESLALVIKEETLTGRIQSSQTSWTIQETDCAMPSLREVHLDLPMMILSQTLDEEIIKFLDIIPWGRLQRLSLTGNGLILKVLEAFRTFPASLRCLHLQAVSWLPTGFMSRILRFPNDIPNRSFAQETLSAGQTATVAQISLMLQDHALEELKLEGFDTSLSLVDILSPKLRKLKLHMCELLPVCPLRQIAELQHLSRLAPNIEHLELDVGRIGNLWHATAVPGVDVDVRIYQVLDAITALPHLKSLRLFPRYSDDGDYFDSRLAQPLGDGAAVRLFRKLKAKSKSLETLAISSDNYVVDHVDLFDPMSWELRAAGGNISLVVRQARRDYEQRQVWVDERRLRTSLSRFSYPRPYVPEFEGWMMES